MSDFALVWLPCQTCGRLLRIRPSDREARLSARFCSADCVTAWRHQRDIASFWERVQKTESCWLWTGWCNSYGYGQLKVRNHARIQFAHRFSWEIAVGPIPEGHVVRHLVCDNPPCVRPDHLALGLQRDNVADMHAKGRQRPNSRLTDNDIRAIRDAAEGGTDLPSLAARYGVVDTTLSRIIRRKSWRHVE
jgi:hypothetical protein